jgi:cytochrome c oxidase subunit 2
MKRLRLCLSALPGLLAAACASVPISPGHTPSALSPNGPGAAHLAELWWVMLGLGMATWVLVIVLLFAAVGRRRRGSSATVPDSRSKDRGRNWILWGGIALPLTVIGVVFGYSTYTLAAVEAPPGPPAVDIHVIGRRWWWEIQYPDQGVITANEIHLPVGVPVKVRLESADVIHSFWVPELHGKMDLIPTRINDITLQADQTGVYRGECAEFCGLQHAHMGFMVVAQSSEEFDAWLAAQQAPATPPVDPLAARGQEVFLGAGCSFCHTVRGLDDKSLDRSAVDLGPDLTHLSSRLTLAGASLTANRGNLAGWVLDPQHVKPGALMPNNNNLEAGDLQALLAYLAGLQ